MIDPKVPPGGRSELTPGMKLLFAILVAFVLSIPLFSIYLLVYDRSTQYETARSSIVEGWGGAQLISGPILAIPYQTHVSEIVTERGKQVEETHLVWKDLELSPETVTIDTAIKPEHRYHSIYEAIVYEASLKGEAKFTFPDDLGRYGITAESLAYDRAEIRFGLSDARGLFGEPPHIGIDRQTLKLQPGHGPKETGGSGFFAWLDATTIRKQPILIGFNYNFRGSDSLTLSPHAGDSIWKVNSPWPNPSFKGNFLPTTRIVSDSGFEATYRIGNLALGKPLVGELLKNNNENEYVQQSALSLSDGVNAQIHFIQPVDLYNQINRATKYGFLFIGFTFLMFLMFDIIGGVRISSVEYTLVGAALVLFFVLLLAFAEVIGFRCAYAIASAATIGLITTYSAAILKSWRRAGYVGGLLIGLYTALYILLSLEAYALLIGALLLFVALAGVMYATRNLDWNAKRTANK